MPQSSTGFSPFELLYGRSVNGPLDVLKHSWEVKDKSEESVISHILSIRDKLSKMSELAKENLSTAQKKQKQWYDRRARCHQLDVGDHVLVLLPTSSSKLLAQWQGPYTVSRRMGAVNYLVNMNDRKKSQRVFHVNMLRKYHIPAEMSLLAEKMPDTDAEDMPTWNKMQMSDGKPQMKKKLTDEQQTQLVSY